MLGCSCVSTDDFLPQISSSAITICDHYLQSSYTSHHANPQSRLAFQARSSGTRTREPDVGVFGRAPDSAPSLDSQALLRSLHHGNLPSDSVQAATSGRWSRGRRQDRRMHNCQSAATPTIPAAALNILAGTHYGLYQMKWSEKWPVQGSRRGRC